MWIWFVKKKTKLHNKGHFVENKNYAACLKNGINFLVA